MSNWWHKEKLTSMQTRRGCGRWPRTFWGWQRCTTRIKRWKHFVHGHICLFVQNVSASFWHHCSTKRREQLEGDTKHWNLWQVLLCEQTAWTRVQIWPDADFMAGGKTTHQNSLLPDLHSEYIFNLYLEQCLLNQSICFSIMSCMIC